MQAADRGAFEQVQRAVIANATAMMVRAQWVGQTLPNGATVVDMKRRGEDWVVLVVCAEEYEPYATWALSFKAEDTEHKYPMTSLGHYFRKLDDAVKEFGVRCY